jgi:hypothetical protein
MKIVVGILVVAFGLCAVIGLFGALAARQFVKNTVVSEPTQLRAVGQEIAAYEVPEGYSEAFGMQLGPAKTVMITRRDKDPDGLVIMLLQLPSDGTDTAQIEAQMRQMMAQRSGNVLGGQLEPMREMDVILNGQSIGLIVSESEGGADNGMRQISGVFDGTSGPVMLLIMGRIGSWDEEALDAFMTSLQ